jgi:hypothetical protein
MKWSAFIVVTVAVVTALTAANGQSQKSEEPIGILLAAGDIAKCRVKNGRIADGGVAAKTAKSIEVELEEAKRRGLPARVLALGDLAYDHSSTRDFQCFAASWGKFLPSMLPG